MLEHARPIPRVSAISAAEFRRDYELPRRPVLITGALAGRAAFERWSLDYLAEKSGDVPVRIRVSERGQPQLFNGNWHAAFDFENDVSLRAAVARVQDQAGPIVYVQHCNLGTKAPALASEIGSFPYAPARLCSPALLWISGPGTVNPLHWDHHHVALTQVAGEKRFVIFPPEDSSKLASFVDAQFWHNTRLDLRAIDRGRFPQVDRARAWSAAVQPGEILFIPYSWWHYMESDSFSISVSWWWAPSLAIHLRDSARAAATNGLQRGWHALRRAPARRVR
jgi:ribosomal protein L16 Arg81 hydroxylase